MTRRRSVRPRWLPGAVATATCVVLLVTSCGVTDSRGVELGHLRDLARRVEGGGVECPLAIPPGDIRPPGAAADAAIVPLRDEETPGSDGTIGGDDLPTEDSVRIMCRWSVEGRAVTLVVVGVNRGHALASFATELVDRGDQTVVLPFIDVNARLPVGRAAVLPGEPPGAFTRVRASSGDVALTLTVDALLPGVTLPDPAELESRALGIGRSLAD